MDVYGNLFYSLIFLWLFGINGSSIVFPIVFALCISNTGINAELVNAGKEPTALINLQMFRYVLIGGAGNTLVLFTNDVNLNLNTLDQLVV